MIKRMLSWRVRAGMLQLTLGIALIMSMLCSAIIFLAYYNKLGILNQLISNRLRSDAHSGIAYALAMRSQLEYRQQYPVEFLCDEADSVTVIRTPWGVFDRITSTARHGSHTFSRTALVTGSVNPVTGSAVYLAATQASTSMVGHALISGTAYVPEAGFTTGVIDGLGFKGDRFVAGETRRSGPIPLLDTALLWMVKKIPDAKEYDLPETPIGIHPGHHTFQEPAAYYQSADSIYIGDSLSGHVIIRSQLKIIVNRTASLRNIILMAPDIEIMQGFEGSVQCFATRSITVHEKARLDYPSALVLMGHEQDSVISIRDSAQVHGIVVIAGYDQTVGSRGYFKVHKEGFFHGVAYINGAAEIEGKIAGHITLRAFQQREGQAVYGNYFKNGKISSGNRSLFMPGSLLWETGEKLRVAQWLE